ncbi:DUF1761 domain-containing protein [Antribacter gilvus]|uniref:DUF1761 domain-containing protein n=1 Tax=Antribacter gilvus TaxID=2304675 RepID=UPI000F785A0F|nr:DUF1761 domain-containing protein [Antribacter gilvus]
MVPDINYWAVIVATLSTMVVGSIWYTPRAFGNRWMRLAKVDPEMAAAAGPWPIVVTVLVSFVSAWVLAGATFIAWSFYDDGFLTAAVVTGVLLWAGFTAARMITHDAFEGRPAGLTTLNLAHELVTVLVMAVILGVWPPAGV